MSQTGFLGNGWLERGGTIGKIPGFLSDSSIVCQPPGQEKNALSCFVGVT